MARKTRKSGEAPQPAAPKTFKAGLYARLSIEDLRKKASDSIGTQVSLLRGHVANCPDILIAAEYKDINQSGANFDRPGFNKMLADIRAKVIDCVVVKDFSRFGRNHIETGNYLERIFPFMGVRFISVSDGYDSMYATADDALIVPLKNLINEAYAKDISRKSRSKFQVKMKKGEFCGTFAPYGYVYENGTFVIDPVAAEVVRRLFDMVIAGQSDNAIAKQLNSEGILPPGRYRYEQGIFKHEKYNAMKFWHKSVVKRITENPAYLGLLVQGKHRRNITQNRTIYTTADEWITVESTHPPIVDRETFDAVKVIRTNRKQLHNKRKSGSKRPKSSENIFLGLVVCEDCGRVLQRCKEGRKAEHIRYRFKCPTFMQNSSESCSPKNLPEDELYCIVQKLLEVQIQALADVKRIFESVRKQSRFIQKGNLLDANIAKVTARLSKLTGLRSSLYEDLKEGLLAEDDYTLAKSQYDAEHEALTANLAYLNEQKAEQNDMVGQNKWATAYSEFSGQSGCMGEQFRAGGTTSLELNWEMLVCLIESITVDAQNNTNIRLKYRDEYERLIGSLNEYVHDAGQAPFGAAL